MNNTVNNLMELGKKYNFKIEVTETEVNLIAINTFNKDVKWISCDLIDDSVSIFDDTDTLNIWLCETRVDFTPDVCIQFVSDLNKALDLPDYDRILLRQLIAPEDWQEIANVKNAYEDSRYSGNM